MTDLRLLLRIMLRPADDCQVWMTARPRRQVHFRGNAPQTRRIRHPDASENAPWHAIASCGTLPGLLAFC
jgi:hypothetical protein